MAGKRQPLAKERQKRLAEFIEPLRVTRVSGGVAQPGDRER